MLKVTISGSYRKHFERLVEAKQAFEALGVRVLRPHAERIDVAEADLVRLEGDPDDARQIQRAQLEAVGRSDLLYVVNPGGYIGTSAAMEIGHANRGGTPVITAEEPFEAAIGAVISAVGTPAQAVALISSRKP
jgi:hypothetical protein